MRCSLSRSRLTKAKMQRRLSHSSRRSDVVQPLVKKMQRLLSRSGATHHWPAWRCCWCCGPPRSTDR
jgi:hypothetical protein